MKGLKTNQKVEQEAAGVLMKCFVVLLFAYGDILSGSDLAGSPATVQGGEIHTRRIIVSLPDKKLVLLENDHVIRIYPIAVGATVSPSPIGSFQIISRVTDPTYYHNGVVIPPGSSNPLGDRWMGLSKKGYGIHGTNVPSSIGKAASHGCIRMGKRDVEELFTLVHVGDEVEIHDERDEMVRPIFGEPANTPAGAGKTATAAVMMAAAAGEL
jgi:hypothetical protein